MNLIKKLLPKQLSKNKKTPIITLLIMIISLIPNFIFPANQSIGDAKFISPQTTVSISGLNNKILVGAMMDEGFSFADENTSCSFYSAFPVQGNFDLKGGRLFLHRKLNFDDTFNFVSPAKIYGNNHCIEFVQSNSTIELPTTNFTPNPFLFNAANIKFNSNANMQINSQFDGNCTIDASNHSIILDSATPISVLQDSSLTLKNAKLSIDNHPSISISNSNASLKLENILLEIPTGIEVSVAPIEVYGKQFIQKQFSWWSMGI